MVDETPGSGWFEPPAHIRKVRVDPEVGEPLFDAMRRQYPDTFVGDDVPRDANGLINSATYAIRGENEGEGWPDTLDIKEAEFALAVFIDEKEDGSPTVVSRNHFLCRTHPLNAATVLEEMAARLRQVHAQKGTEN